MKKPVLAFILAVSLSAALPMNAQNRYLDEVFLNTTVTTAVYSSNISVLTGDTMTVPLNCDIYQPADDWIATRPLVIYLHTGSFLPIIINTTATGSMRDSAAVEMCEQFARRGYVSASMDYRVGWNPAALGSSGQDIRTGTLLQAVYRAIQDAKACVRYFKMTAATMGNPYRIDTGKIMLVGQGSGGYVVLAYATLDDPAEIELLKFLSTTTDLNYGFVAGEPYVTQAVMGDFEGFGGLPGFNIENWPGYSSKVHMAVNMGGALGDSSWIEAGDVPMIAFHSVNDPFGPYGLGTVDVPCSIVCSCPVIVPTTGDFVVNVSGSLCTIIKADEELNNNLPFHAYADNATDPYTLRANSINDGHEGLFPFELIDPSILIPGNPFHGQAGPWEWWDSMDLQILAPFLQATAAQATSAYLGSLLTNPDMSKDKALGYIDTIQNYIAPRAAVALGLDTMHINIGVNEVNLSNLKISPNPSTSYFNLHLDGPSQNIDYIQLFDLTGRLVLEIPDIKNHHVKISRENLPDGFYNVKIGLKGSELNGKIILQ